MKAVQLVEIGKPLEAREVGLPSVGERDVLVRVKAAGICHSDAAILNMASNVCGVEALAEF